MVRWWLALIVAHVVVLRKVYVQNPWCLAAGEPLQWEFPAFRVLGRALRRGEYPPQDTGFLASFAGHPLTSCFYPSHVVLAWLTAPWPVDVAWLAYQAHQWGHLAGSLMLCWSLLVTHLSVLPPVAFLLALSLTHNSYVLKANAPLVYTMAWVPVGLLAALAHHLWWLGGALMMVGLAGYWPVAVPTLGMAGLAWVVGW